MRPYLNVGYVTNIKKCSECLQPDAGGSIRAGVLTKGRFGFYAGYLWFKEYHPDYIGYDDRGSIILAGIDFLLLRKGDFKWYAKLGLAHESFISTYPTSTETEISIKPDFGVFFNINHINAYLGWQPSDPHHFNIGLGFTL